MLSYVVTFGSVMMPCIKIDNMLYICICLFFRYSLYDKQSDDAGMLNETLASVVL